VKLPFLGKTRVATTHEMVNEVLKDDRTFVRNPKNPGKQLQATGTLEMLLTATR
jgi:hypothetical protein